MPLRPAMSGQLNRISAKFSSVLHEPAVRRRLARQVQANETCPFAVYFADTPDGAYQLEQWLPALATLASSGTPVAILMSNATAVGRLLDTCPVPIHLCTGSAAVEAFIREHSVEVVFYVNNNQANFTTLRVNGPLHVHLSHGESEKSSMFSNQLKAYDAAFIAGTASRERILKHVRRIDPSHLIEIGRPQLDCRLSRMPDRSGAPVVLYAPTWEGDSPEMAYSSLVGSGATLAHALSADPRVTFTFRPHPKTGTKSAIYGRALRKIERLAAGTQPGSGTDIRRPDSCGAITDIARADVVISDVSAMAMDAVGLDKPTVILANDTIPASGKSTGLTASVTFWPALPANPVDEILTLAKVGTDPRQQAFRDHVFGRRELGTGTERFVRASHDLLESATD